MQLSPGARGSRGDARLMVPVWDNASKETRAPGTTAQQLQAEETEGSASELERPTSRMRCKIACCIARQLLVVWVYAGAQAKMRLVGGRGVGLPPGSIQEECASNWLRPHRRRASPGWTAGNKRIQCIHREGRVGAVELP